MSSSHTCLDFRRDLYKRQVLDKVDGDPALDDLGIYIAKHAWEKHDWRKYPDKSKSKIYVTHHLRTWMTALCKYIPKKYEQTSNQDEQTSNQDEQTSNQDEQTSNQDEQTSNQDEQTSNQDEQKSNQDEQTSNQDEQTSNQDEQTSNQDEQKSNNNEGAIELHVLYHAFSKNDRLIKRRSSIQPVIERFIERFERESGVVHKLFTTILFMINLKIKKTLILHFYNTKKDKENKQNRNTKKISITFIGNGITIQINDDIISTNEALRKHLEALRKHLGLSENKFEKLHMYYLELLIEGKYKSKHNNKDFSEGSSSSLRNLVSKVRKFKNGDRPKSNKTKNTSKDNKDFSEGSSSSLRNLVSKVRKFKNGDRPKSNKTKNTSKDNKNVAEPSKSHISIVKSNRNTKKCKRNFGGISTILQRYHGDSKESCHFILPDNYCISKTDKDKFLYCTLTIFTKKELKDGLNKAIKGKEIYTYTAPATAGDKKRLRKETKTQIMCNFGHKLTQDKNSELTISGYTIFRHTFKFTGEKELEAFNPEKVILN